MATAASGGSALGKDSLEKIGKHLVANSKTNEASSVQQNPVPFYIFFF